ncbi:pentatricopeptide repeat-containing protein At2g29760, chloroplastic-like [Typha latifolia]|uniref:pentatricopeptide repeat-containing protein At2g29760, chloroplastic-like n=1 Tax=Typha latifolia TaxID=4733 RepID=UPI003C2C17DA
MSRCWRRAEEDRIVELVSRCSSLRHLKQLHARVIVSGHSNNSFVATKLVRSFAELGSLRYARVIANSVRNPNAFVWNSLIRAYSQADSPDSSREAIFLYTQMHKCPQVEPLSFTLSSALKASARLMALAEGAQIHAHVYKYGLQNDARVQTTLIDLYGKCGQLVEARRNFDGIVRAGAKDVQVWNTMIAAYATTGDMESAEFLFARMPERNTFTWVEMIGGYAACGKLHSARWILESGLDNRDVDKVVSTAMISGYAKCGDVAAARLIFDEMRERDVASWNAMISAYSNAGLTDDALDLFKIMLRNSGLSKVEPNHATISTIVSVCAHSGSPKLANWIQGYVDHCCLKLLNNHTVAALIDLHSKCGDLERAYKLFSKWKHKDLICYSSMIAGFGIYGRGKDAIGVFNELKEANLKPDGICFVSVLTACSHSGMVDEGRRYFQMMKDEYHILPTGEHYMCIVDLLGRAGCIDEAYKMITSEMPPSIQTHAGIWGALLSACRTYSNVKVGEEAARHLMELEPENAGNYVLLSNIYAKAQKWEGVAWIRALMRSRGMRKPPGWSQVDMESGFVKFITGEVYDSHLEMVLELLNLELKDQGYIGSIVEVE